MSEAAEVSIERAASRVGRYRWVIVGLLFAATAINYIDRQMIGLLKPIMMEDPALHMDERTYADIVVWFQVAYAIGVARPVSVLVDTFGTGTIADEKISKLVEKHFDLRPKGIIQALNLLRPIYLKTAAYGHFGRDEPEFSWEATEKAAALKADAK